MRKTFIYSILIFLVSCADMHDPILHDGGYVRFVPTCDQEVDSVILERMTKYFEFEWSSEIFTKELNDYHVDWWNSESLYEINFIKVSDKLYCERGEYFSNWYTNPYNNNRISNNVIFTDFVNDSICKPPDYVFSSPKKIFINETVEDYDINRPDKVQEIHNKLLQRSFLYVVQIKLKNNNGRIKGVGTFLISGQAEKFNCITEQNEGIACHTFSPQFKNDIIVGSFMSFGLPNCNSYDFRYKYRNNLQDYDIIDNNILYIQLVYKSNKRNIIGYNVSEQMKLQPTGGLILIELNVDDYPEPEIDFNDPFNVFVNDYESIDQYYNNI